MDVVYYLSGIAIFLLLPAAITALIWPGFYTGVLRHHATRSKIIACLVALLFVFGGAVGATEPQSIKDARAAREQAAALSMKEEASAKAKAEQAKWAQAAEAAKPKITTKTIVAKEAIAFIEEQRSDAKITKGQTKVAQHGVNGEKTITYKVTYTDGKETTRKVISEQITKLPVSKIAAVGTYVAPTPKTASKPAATTSPAPAASSSSCDPNYSGCVPVASDVDCAGGTGNGPVYFSGSTRVIGTDLYGLDRDKNGIACD